MIYFDLSKFRVWFMSWPYKYMGRNAPKERKNRGKVTKILWGDAIMIILVCKMRGYWADLLRRGGAQEASFSHACVTRTHSLQTCTFCFHNLHHRRHYSSLSFLTPRYFSVFNACLPWSIFPTIFSILGRKIIWSVKKCPKEVRFSLWLREL